MGESPTAFKIATSSLSCLEKEGIYESPVPSFFRFGICYTSPKSDKVKSVVCEKIFEIGTTRDDKSHPQPIHSPFFNVSFMGLIFGKWGMNMSLLQPYEGEFGEKMLIATDWCLVCSRI